MNRQHEARSHAIERADNDRSTGMVSRMVRAFCVAAVATTGCVWMPSSAQAAVGDHAPGFLRSNQMELDADVVGIAVDARLNRMYLLDAGPAWPAPPEPGSVTVLDAATKAPITEIAVDAQPWQMAVNSSSGKLYVADAAGVSVIDGVSLTVVATIPIGDGVSSWVGDFVVDEANNVVYALVVDQSGCSEEPAVRPRPKLCGESSLVAIDGALDQLRPGVRISLPTFVEQMVLDPLARRIYVLDVNGVLIVDLRAGHVTRRFPSTDGASSIAVDPVRKEIYVARHYDSTITAISTRSFGRSRTFATDWPINDLAFDPITGGLYATSVRFVEAFDPVSGVSSEYAEISNGRMVLDHAGRMYVDGFPDLNTCYFFGDCERRLTEFTLTQSTSMTNGPATEPRTIAINPTTNRIYVVNNRASNVVVLDATSGDVITSIPVSAPIGDSLWDIAVNTVTNRVYVTSRVTGVLTVIDGATNAAVAGINVAVSATENPVSMGVAIDERANRVFVANTGDGTVSAVDGANDTVIANVAVGGEPVDLVHDPDTERLYVAQRSTSSIAVVDATSLDVVGSIPLPLGSTPTAVGLVSANGLLYVAARGQVIVVDTATERIRATVPIPVSVGSWGEAWDVAVDQASAVVFVAYRSEGLAVIDGLTAQRLALLDTDRTGLAGVAVDQSTGATYLADGTRTIHRFTAY